MNLQSIYHDIAVAHGTDPERWASTSGTALVRVALPYSLKQLNKWLSGGGMALGAPTAFCFHGDFGSCIICRWLHACVHTEHEWLGL